MKRITLSILLSLASLSLWASTSYNKLVIFGDSLSDNGNLYNYSMHFLPKSPPYFQGRFSNGPVWSEYMVKKAFGKEDTEKLLDYAVGGAGAIIAKDENLPYSLSAEVDNFLYLHSYADRTKMLYTVFIGANNYINGPTNIEEITSAVVDGIEENIQTLIDRDAKTFLIFTMPDLGISPDGIEYGNTQLLTTLSNVHNQKLLVMVKKLQAANPSIRFVTFDMQEAFNYIKTHPEYGITNLTEACYDGGFMLAPQAKSNQSLKTYLKGESNTANWTNLNFEQFLQNPDFKEATRVAAHFKQNPYRLASTDEELNCDTYLFWDHLHPSGKAHQILASLVDKRLKEENILPETEK